MRGRRELTEVAEALESGASPAVETMMGSVIDTVKRNPEPSFFILGDKSYGRNSTFLPRVGWQQVDEVFAELAGRP